MLITRRRSPWILLDQWQNSADAQENRPAVQQRENRKRQGFEPGLRIPSPDRPGFYVHKDSGDAFCACSRLGKAIISPCFFLEGKKSSCLTFQKSNNKKLETGEFPQWTLPSPPVQIPLYPLATNLQGPSASSQHPLIQPHTLLLYSPSFHQIIEREEGGEILGIYFNPCMQL